MNTKKKPRYGTASLERRLGPMSVGEFLRSWRESEELSQRDFARMLKISATNLCDIEKGRKCVSPEKAEEIAGLLGYSKTVLVRLALQEQLASAGLRYILEVKPAS